MTTVAKDAIFDGLKIFQRNSTTEKLAFLDGAAAKVLWPGQAAKPHQKVADAFPANLTVVAGESGLSSVGPQRRWVGGLLDLPLHPKRGVQPTILDKLGFLHPKISHACLALCSETAEGFRSVWLGREALAPTQFWSATKFVAPLRTIDAVCAGHPDQDIDDCVLSVVRQNFPQGIFPFRG